MDATKEDLTRMYYDDGLTLAEIGQRFGVSKQAVAQRMEKYNIPRRPNTAPTRVEKEPELEKKLRAFVEETNLTQQEIADRLDSTAGSVRRWTEIIGLDVNWRERARPGKDVNVYYAKKLYWEDGLTLEEVGEEFDCTAMTILKHFRENGIPTRKRGSNRK